MLKGINPFLSSLYSCRIYDKVKELGWVDIDIKTFQSFVERHQAFLYPAFEIQIKFRNAICGREFWDTLIAKRTQMFNNRYIPLKEIVRRYEERVDLSRHAAANTQRTFDCPSSILDPSVRYVRDSI